MSPAASYASVWRHIGGWHRNDWMVLDNKPRSSIVAETSVFLRRFDMPDYR